MSVSRDNPEPGWFPDPSGTPQTRFWNGTHWTAEVRPYASPTGIISDSATPGGASPSALTPEQNAQTGKSATKGCLVIVGIIILLGIIIGVGTAVSSSQDSSSTTSSQGSGSTTDPIEQARVVLGGGYTYAIVKSATDEALTAAGVSLTDENRSRAWSAVLSVTQGLSEKGYEVDPMSVITCVPGLARVGNTSLPDSIALCGTELALKL